MQTEEEKISRIAEKVALRIVKIYGNGGGGTSSAIESWVSENFLSIEFFSNLFKAYGPAETEGDPDIEILPNDTQSTISNIKAMFGFWTEQYVSALGQNPDGGGGSVVLNACLSSINASALGVPTGVNTGLIFNGNTWVYREMNDINMSAVWQALGASTSEQINISHLTDALVNYATASDVGTLQGYFTNGQANSALEADTLATARTIWGQSFDGSANITGNMTGVTNIDALLYFDTTNSRIGVIQQSPAYTLDVTGTMRLTGAATFGSTMTVTGLITANGGITIPSGQSLTIGDAVITWDATAQGIKITKGLYSETFISALGAGSGGSGGGVDMTTVWQALAASTSEQINASHLTGALSGYATQSYVATYVTNNLALYNLSDVDVSGVTSGQYLKFNGQKWVDGDFTGTLATLFDVNIGTKYDGQVLTWNASSSKWIAAIVSGGSGSYLPITGGTLSGVLNVSATGSNRANINLISPTDVPTDFYFGSGGSQYWSLSSRGSSENKFIGLYNAMTYRWGFILTANNHAIFGDRITDWSTSYRVQIDGTQYITGQLTSGVSTGTSPFIISSSTVVSNLNADMLDGYHSSDFATSNSLANYLPLSGGTLTGTLSIINQSNRSVIHLITKENAPCDLWLGSSNTDQWSITCRDSSEGYSLDIYTTYSVGDGHVIKIAHNTGDITAVGQITASKFIKSGGASSQFLKADGSVDSTAYAAASSLSDYLPLAGGTLTGNLSVKNNASGARSTISLISVGNVPNDMEFGNNNTIKWSISSRDSSDSYKLIFYSVGLAGGDYPMEIEYSTGLVRHNYDSYVKQCLNVGAYLAKQSTNRAEIHLLSSGDYPCDFILGSNSSYKWSITARNSSDSYDFRIYNNSVGDAIAIKKSNNYFGIGTNSPSYKLHVAGDIYATGGVTCLSDARKKDVVCELPMTVEDVAGAPAVRFLWKDNRVAGNQAGTLAQYWQKVLPEVITDKSGELSMQYGVAALVAAIVTARKVVDHERRIKELESENAQLRKDLDGTNKRLSWHISDSMPLR